MYAFHYPFRDFPDQCYRVEEGTIEGDLSIKDIHPVDDEHWLKDETERLYWQFQHLKESRQEKIAAATTTSENTTMDTPATFHQFTRLSTELRLGIFSFMSGGYTRQRVHRIHNRPDSPLEFISNQPISPLLHICSESRHEYLKQTGCTFAFESYVNISRDMFYFMDTNSPGDFQRLTTFFNSEEAKPIKTVAIRQTLFQNVIHLIPESMNEIEEIAVVFEQWTSWKEMWGGGEVQFVETKERKPKKRSVHEESDNIKNVASLIMEMARRRLDDGDWWTVNTGKKINFSVGVVKEVQ